MKVLAIIQARMGSTRLPGKVMADIFGIPLIQIIVDRASCASTVDEIIVATTDDSSDDFFADYLNSKAIPCYRGSDKDVLGRFLGAAQSVNATIIVRITGDCPLIDPGLVDEAVNSFLKLGVDYLSNCMVPTYPDGLDVEVFSFAALKKAADLAINSSDREHVTPFLRNSGLFETSTVTSDIDYSSFRWTVDEAADLEVIRQVFDHFSPNIFFKWTDVALLNREKPEIFAANRGYRRNEGKEMTSGQKLWRRAKRVIPGGNMLLSKRPEMFLPEKWPCYFEKAKGCDIWDLDGNRYTDMSIMGVGTNLLGYGNPEVDAAVSRVIAKGNLSTLNAPEEVLLAEKLIDLHPWAGMARFARTGGEANAIAIRIARAATGREKIAICGYHGWHDWYLAANLETSDHLAGHLLPGLEPAGVPSSLTGSAIAFEYNDIAGLENLLNIHEVAAIKMEVFRNVEPDLGFLARVKALARAHGAVLIFDECTSGFRETNGGLHKKFDVEPDMAMFGKALGNGYAVTAIVGREEVMQAAQSSFISSTFWTERIGSAAALKTLEVMAREKSWEIVTEIGSRIQSRWRELAVFKGLKIHIFGMPALAGFNLESPNWMKYKTLITQEMLAQGFLCSNVVYSCVAHSEEVVDEYFENLERVFDLIAQCEDGRDIDEVLAGPVCHSGFKRLN